jgi:hypothetical protein
MYARARLDHLIAARPALLDHTERIVDAEQEDRILGQILCSARPAGALTVPRARAGGKRSRRLVTAVVAGAAAATLAAAGVLVGAGAFRGGSAGSTARQGSAAAIQVHVISAKTLAARTVRAVNAASRTDILYSHTVFANGTTARSTAALDEWDYGISVREKLFNAQGSLTNDVSVVVTHGMRDRRFVFYDEKTWQQDSIQADHYGPPEGVRATVNSLLDVKKAGTRSGGSRSVIRHVNVNGRQMLKVTDQWSSDQGGLSPLPLFTDSQIFPSATIGKAFAETVWIDQASDLPVRVILTASGGRVLASETFAWLTPDQANLAELTPAPIPAGFRETTPPAR